MVRADRNGRPLYGLSDTEASPYLAYGPDSILGSIVSMMLNSLERQPRLEVRYENSMACALKAMALEGHGIAWLPRSCSQIDIEAGRLVALDNQSLHVKVDVSIYRLTSLSNSSTERFWRMLTRRTALSFPKEANANCLGQSALT